MCTLATKALRIIIVNFSKQSSQPSIRHIINVCRLITLTGGLRSERSRAVVLSFSAPRPRLAVKLVAKVMKLSYTSRIEAIEGVRSFKVHLMVGKEKNVFWPLRAAAQRVVTFITP